MLTRAISIFFKMNILAVVYIFPLLLTMTKAEFPDCPSNEVFMDCGTACERTCQSPRNTMCTDQCVVGCFCHEGYIREYPGGRCVPSCKRLPMCPMFEVFMECGTACEPTLQNPKPTICTKQCVAGCFCQRDYIRESLGGRCVPDRIPKCPKYEVFMECGTACEPTLQNPTPEICTEQCVAGCFCQKGYIRESPGGRCVPDRGIPDCPKYEVFMECGTACEPTLENPKPEICTKQCVAGCFCQNGYIRENLGRRCVPICGKIPECPENEVFTECGSSCEPTCQNPKPEVCTFECVIGCVCQEGYIREGPGGRCVPSCKNVPICSENEIFATCVGCPRYCNQTEPTICPLICTTGCRCEEGYVRRTRSDGRCIPEVSCKTKCDENEVYKDCGTVCPGTCSQPVRVCNKKCASGCFCKDGYILDDVTRKCIRESDCPK